MSDNGSPLSPANAVLRWIERPWVQALLCLTVAFAMRASAFGDPNIHIDEGFYATVGQWMHHGALPYVDIWDRKPPMLFAIYGLIAFLPGIILPYQLVATGFAAATAFVIVRLTVRLGAGQPGPLLAGLIYLVMMPPLGGLGGQSPVFYNLFMALAALLVWTSRTKMQTGAVPRRLWLAMLFAGLAIATKQTALFEAAFLGLYACWQLRRAGAPAKRIVGFAAIAVLIGLSPFLLAFIYYATVGHFAELWHAMVLSNVSKSGLSHAVFVQNMTKTGLVIAPVLLIAFAGVVMALRRRESRSSAFFLLGWIGAALLGFFAVPNAYEHYALPFLLPLSVAASFVLARPLLGITLSVMILYWSLKIVPMNPAMHAKSAAAVERLAEVINGNLGNGERRVLIYDGTPILYVLTNSAPGTALVFPQHMLVEREMNVSHLDHRAELARVIAARPRVVVMQKRTASVADAAGFAMVQDYISQNCTLIGEQTFYYDNDAREYYLVYGNCRQDSGSAVPRQQ